MKPDIIRGTESWLKGIKPGKESDNNCIKNCEVLLITLTFIGLTELHKVSASLCELSKAFPKLNYRT